MSGHVAFDIETTGVDLDACDITCCAARIVENGTVTTRAWHSGYADAMAPADLVAVVEALHAWWLRGLVVVTFNGAKFDLAMMARKLAAHPEAAAKLNALALDHCDIMLQFLADRGYYASMNSFAAGCNLAPKTWSGAEASQAWQGQPRESKDRVLAYCAEDVRCLSDLYRHIAEHGTATRVTKRGSTQVVQFPVHSTVRAAIQQIVRSPPDTSWMDAAPDPLEGLAWLGP